MGLAHLRAITLGSQVYLATPHHLSRAASVGVDSARLVCSMCGLNTFPIAREKPSGRELQVFTVGSLHDVEGKAKGM